MYDTIFEKIRNDIITCNITLSDIYPREASDLSIFALDFDINRTSKKEVDSFEMLEDETDIQYDIFQLYCFYNMSMKEIYDLLIKYSSHVVKSNVKDLDYNRFLTLKDMNHFDVRKENYIQTMKKNSKDYLKKINQRKKIKENIETNNLHELYDDYKATLNAIECLNSDMKEISNNEDISAEKRIEYIEKYSKTSLKLNDKKFNLFHKITSESVE